MPVVDWNKPLERPIPRKGKPPVVTLYDAYQVLLDMPKKKQAEPIPQACAEALIMAAEGRGPMHTAQAAASVAVNGEQEIPTGPREKPKLKIGKRLSPQTEKPS